MSSLSAFPTVVETSLHPVSSKVVGAAALVQFDLGKSEFPTPKKSPIINLAAAPADPGLATGLQMKIHYCKSNIKLWEDLIADPT